MFALFDKAPDTLPELTWDVGGHTNRAVPAEISRTDNPDPARLAGAVWMETAVTKEESLSLALKYQLVSRQTALFLVYLRDGEDKVTELPQIHQVPQMMAFGSHGYKPLIGSSLLGSVDYCSLLGSVDYCSLLPTEIQESSQLLLESDDDEYSAETHNEKQNEEEPFDEELFNILRILETKRYPERKERTHLSIFDLYRFFDTGCRNRFFETYETMLKHDTLELTGLILFHTFTFLIGKLDDLFYERYGAYIKEIAVFRRTEAEADVVIEQHIQEREDFKNELRKYLLNEIFFDAYYPSTNISWLAYFEIMMRKIDYYESRNLNLTYLFMIVMMKFLVRHKDDPEYIEFNNIITGANTKENIERFYCQYREEIFEFGRDMYQFIMARLDSLDIESVERLYKGD
jgi:hypothetical protein